MIRIPTQREPTHPGEMLLEEFLKPMGITQQRLAREIKVGKGVKANVYIYFRRYKLRTNLSVGLFSRLSHFDNVLKIH